MRPPEGLVYYKSFYTPWSPSTWKWSDCRLVINTACLAGCRATLVFNQNYMYIFSRQLQKGFCILPKRLNSWVDSSRRFVSFIVHKIFTMRETFIIASLRKINYISKITLRHWGLGPIFFFGRCNLFLWKNTVYRDSIDK